MSEYLPFVTALQESMTRVRDVSVTPRRNAPIASDDRVLLFSPHPDDECIIGALPLRLMREAGMQIINVPVTFGSNVERRAERAAELENACAYLGWENARARDDLENLGVDDVRNMLLHYRPRVIVFPHDQDWNTRHIATHALLMNALQVLPPDLSCTVVETEFWGAMDDPNLVVEVDAPTLADLMAATALHVGEVERNPYHLTLPAWMQDNVRRGGELVGGQGAAAPDFAFATLYRLRRFEGGSLHEVLESGTYVPCGASTLQEII